MGESELKRALQREGEEQICTFWQQAESAVASRRKEVEAELMQLRRETDRQLQGEATELRNNLLFEAQTRAMCSRLHEEAALEERLLHLAHQLLPEMASNGRAALWKTLCEELPESDWTILKVHPADQTLAGRDFPAARIESDETLGGGLIATNTDGKIRIDNSLSCRLLRAWPDLVPKLLGEFRKRVDNDETARTDKAG
jgi:vacuolar-type H+-ATPase subunit E/Vma4